MSYLIRSSFFTFASYTEPIKKKGSIKAEPVCHLKLNHLHHDHEDDGEEGQHHLQFLVLVQLLDLLFEQENQFLGERIF
jgi:hypothetical protein